MLKTQKRVLAVGERVAVHLFVLDTEGQTIINLVLLGLSRYHLSAANHERTLTLCHPLYLIGLKRILFQTIPNNYKSKLSDCVWIQNGGI